MTRILAILALLFNPVPAYSQSDVSCMAHAVYHEARGETTKGKEAVAHVILNRLNSGLYGKQICGIVYQPHQFTNIKLTKPNFASPEWQESMVVSITALNGLSKDPTNGARFFFAQKIVRPKWAYNKPKVTIGNHTFI